MPAVSARVPRGVTDGVLEPATKKRRSGVSRAEYERLRLRAFGGEAVPKDVVRADNVAEYDPWDQGAERAEEADFSFLDPVRPAKAPGTLRMKPVSLLEGDKVLPAVAKPQGGLSYNPVFEEWDSLIEREGEKEVEAERRRMAAAKAEQEQQAKIAAALAEDEEAWRTEDESVWEGFESEKSTEVHLPAKLPKRKTPVERNKAKRRKQREQAERYAQGMKRTGMRVVGSKVQREAAAAEKAAAEIGDAPQTGEEEAVQSSDDEIDERLLRRRRLGKHRFVFPVEWRCDTAMLTACRLPEKELELVLPDELQDSLRLLKPEGNLLKDRFRSMMIRGKLETRRPLPQQKKAKRYETEKWSYKDWTLPGISV